MEAVQTLAIDDLQLVNNSVVLSRLVFGGDQAVGIFFESLFEDIEHAAVDVSLVCKGTTATCSSDLPIERIRPRSPPAYLTRKLGN